MTRADLVCAAARVASFGAVLVALNLFDPRSRSVWVLFQIFLFACFLVPTTLLERHEARRAPEAQSVWRLGLGVFGVAVVTLPVVLVQPIYAEAVWAVGPNEALRLALEGLRGPSRWVLSAQLSLIAAAVALVRLLPERVYRIAGVVVVGFAALQFALRWGQGNALAAAAGSALGDAPASLVLFSVLFGCYRLADRVTERWETAE